MNSKSYLLLALVLVLARNVFAGPVGNTVFVDAVNGNDTTGMRGQADLPFLTLGAAKAAASSGDTIIVRPGTYNENNLLKDGVTWDFRGATVHYPGTSAAIFDDSINGTNGPVTCTVIGNGVFIADHTRAVYLRNLSTFNIEAKSITGANAIVSRNATTTVRAGTITGTGTAGIWWYSGSMFVEADVLSCGGNATVYSTAPQGEQQPDAYLWVNVKHIVNTGSNANNKAVFFQDNDPTAREWINALEIEGPIAINTSGPGSLGYVKAEKIFGQINHVSGTLYVDTQKVSSFGLSDDLIKLGGTGSWLNISQIDDAAVPDGKTAVTVSSGTHYLSARSLIRSTAGDGVSVSGGALSITGTSISTQSGSNDLVQSGGSLTVAGCSYSKTSGTITSGPNAQFGSGSSNPADGNTYQFFRNTADNHLYGWNGSAWKQLDN